MDMRRSAILLAALIIDQVIDNPPNQFHPVIWRGSTIAIRKRHTPACCVNCTPDKRKLQLTYHEQKNTRHHPR
ncbi:hypothetical protein ACFLYO_03595 [Chloroflexota bacterium]